MNILQDLSSLENEPLISDENEQLFQDMLNLERTSDFTAMNLSEEKLDELYSCLEEQETYLGVIADIPYNLQEVPSITVIDDTVDFI